MKIITILGFILITLLICSTSSAVIVKPGIKFKEGDIFYIVQKTMNVKSISINENYLIFVYWDWDVTEDGSCSLLDLIYVSNHYGEKGEPGWIKEDTKADGLINIYDLVFVVNFWENK